MPAAGKTNTVHLHRGDKILVHPFPGRPDYVIESAHKRKGNPEVMIVDRVQPVVVRDVYGRVKNRYDVHGTVNGRSVILANTAGNQTYILA